MPEVYEALVIESPYDTTVTLHHELEDAFTQLRDVIDECNLEPEDKDYDAKSDGAIASMVRSFVYVDDRDDYWNLTITPTSVPA